MARLNLFLWRQARTWYRLAYGAAVLFFLWTAAQYYLPGKGFTCLIYFGGAPGVHRIRELRHVDYYVYKDSYGYDAQYYAQMAIKPLLRSRDLEASVDNLPYRARRILFSWTAYLLGLGQPDLILQAYALQNIIAWVLLAWLLMRWFPPTSLNHFVRWAGVLFAVGMTMSVREALMDGPSLLLIAWGVALAEQGRRWWSAGVLGVAGLGRETNLLAALSLAPGRNWSREEVLRAAGRGLVAALPLAAWVGCLWFAYGAPSNFGAGNFAAPFSAFMAKWFGAVRDFAEKGWDSSARWLVIILLSLTVQFLTLVLRPRWSDPWWRIGMPFAVLFVFLGPAVWDGFPGAAARVVLPMTLAFNMVVPRTRRWWPVLLLGNLSVLSAADQLKAPGREGYEVEGPATVWMTPAQDSIEVSFPGNWYQTEKSHLEYWRWSRGSADLIIHNPQPVPVEVNLYFGLRAFDVRTVRVLQGSRLRWEGRIDREGTSVVIAPVRLEPGDNMWHFETDKPPITPSGDTLRPVAFNLRNLVIQAVRKLSPSEKVFGKGPPPRPDK